MLENNQSEETWSKFLKRVSKKCTEKQTKIVYFRKETFAWKI